MKFKHAEDVLKIYEVINLGHAKDIIKLDEEI